MVSPGSVVRAPLKAELPRTVIVPALSTASLKVVERAKKDWPAALVKLPGPLIVALLKSQAVAAVLRSGVVVTVPLLTVRLASVWAKARVTLAALVTSSVLPAPPRVPALWLNDPTETFTVRPEAMAMSPVFVKLGVVPDCEMVKLPPETLMSPELVWCAELLFRVSANP